MKIKSKSKKPHYLTISIIGFLLIVSLYFTMTSWLTSAETTTTVSENNIEQKTTFNYLAEVRPSSIYPEGGLIEPGSTILERVTDRIETSIVTNIQSDQPVKIDGSFHPILTIEAKDYWSKDIPLGDMKTFQIEGNETAIIDGVFNIDVNEIRELIKTIEEEIVISSGTYLLKINPNISGTMVFDNKEVTLDETAELVFEYASNRMRLVSETQEFTNNFPFNRTITEINNYSFYGLETSLSIVRVLSSVFSLLFAATLGYLYMKARGKGRTVISEAQKIDKKYSKYLITVTEELKIINKTFLNINSFEALYKVSEEKELPIFRLEYKDREKVLYFIVDDICIYKFEASNKAKQEPLGSDVLLNV